MKHYKRIADSGDLPPFPERYVTSSLLGRIDLVDIVPLEDY